MVAPTPAEWNFYVAYNLFRGATISQGQVVNSGQTPK